MATDEMMECERQLGGCGFRFTALPGWTIVRRLHKSERSRPPQGTIWCHECHTKWLVAPAGAMERREAA